MKNIALDAHGLIFWRLGPILEGVEKWAQGVRRVGGEVRAAWISALGARD